MHLLAIGIAAAGLTACALAPTRLAVETTPTNVHVALQALPPVRLLLLGEQHDAPAHHALEAATVAHLAQTGRLAALVLEMADRGHDTRGLASNATEAEVQRRLQWNDAGWPWAHYGPTVMAAVRASVPVWGGNQPSAEMRAAMADASLDAHLPTPALAQQREDIRQGHCGLLPDSQLTPMARIQIARDRAMAQTLTEAWSASAQPGQVVMLVAGTQHVLRDLGVPLHLPAEWLKHSQVVVMHSGAPEPGASAAADHLWLTPNTPVKDHCAELRQRWGKTAS